MRQVMVLEKSDLVRLKHGESLKLALPDGKFLEMIVEGANSNGTSAESKNVRGPYKKDNWVDKVKKVMAENGGWMKFAEIKHLLPGIQSATLHHTLGRLCDKGSPYKLGTKTFNKYKYKGD